MEYKKKKLTLIHIFTCLIRSNTPHKQAVLHTLIDEEGRKGTLSKYTHCQILQSQVVILTKDYWSKDTDQKINIPTTGYKNATRKQKCDRFQRQNKTNNSLSAKHDESRIHSN